MKIWDFSVRNRQFTAVMFVMLVALGISALLKIPRTEDPVFPIATSGAAAARLLPEISDMPKPLHDALKEQTAYSVLFQQVLPAQVDRQIAPAWRPSDAQYSWTDHVDPAELDRASPLTDGSIP